MRREILGERGEPGHGDIVLARHRPQREQPLLDLLELCRIEFQRIARHLELGLRLGGFAQGAIERGQRCVETTGRLVRVAFDQAMRRPEARNGPSTLLQLAQRLADRFAQRAAGPHELALAGQRLLVVGLRRQGIEFLYRVAQKRLVPPRRLGGGLRVGMGLLGGAPCRPCRGDGGGLLLEAAEGIERTAMRCRVEQPVLLHLSLDLDQRVAQPSQQRD